MNITNDDENIKQAKTVETIEIYKHSNIKHEKKELIGKLYVRAEYRNVFINEELDVFYIENGNNFVINNNDTINITNKELEFLIKIYPFTTLSQEYISMYIDENFKEKYQLYKKNKWIQTAAMDKSKIYTTTKTKDIVRKYLARPYIITKEQYQKLNKKQKKIYKTKIAVLNSKKNEQNHEYRKIYKNIAF